MSEWIPSTAIILKSVYDPDLASRSGEGTDPQRDSGPLGILVDAKVGAPYEFLLEVARPDGARHQVSIRSRVKTKVLKVGFFQEVEMPTTLEVPVRILADDPTRVEIDWDAFLALPDRVQRLKDAVGRSQGRRVQQMQAADPGKYSALHAQNHQVAMSWAESVRAGKMTRAEFERDGANLVRVGLMLQADYDAGLARIDEP